MSGIRVTHYIPGRLRLQVGQVKHNEPKAQSIRTALEALPGIRRVQTNATTGSVLIVYQNSALKSAQTRERLREVVNQHLGSDELQVLDQYLARIG